MPVTRAICLCLAAWLPLAAGEEIVLTTGFRLRADRHAVEGGEIHLYSGESVTILPLSVVSAIETAADVPPPTPPAAPPEAREPQTPVDPHALVTEAAIREGLPPELLHSLARVESGYRQDAVSPKGAVGIMQLMPQTARELGADPADPRQNVAAGARYLRALLLKYLDDPNQLHKALAAYNAGPGAVDRYGGVPPYRETIEYVRRVLEQRRRSP